MCSSDLLQSPSAVILKPRKIKSDTVSTVSPSICHEVIGTDGAERLICLSGSNSEGPGSDSEATLLPSQSETRIPSTV